MDENIRDMVYGVVFLLVVVVFVIAMVLAAGHDRATSGFTRGAIAVHTGEVEVVDLPDGTHAVVRVKKEAPPE
jgi:hypothetical protein